MSHPRSLDSSAPSHRSLAVCNLCLSPSEIDAPSSDNTKRAEEDTKRAEEDTNVESTDESIRIVALDDASVIEGGCTAESTMTALEAASIAVQSTPETTTTTSEDAPVADVNPTAENSATTLDEASAALHSTSKDSKPVIKDALPSEDHPTVAKDIPTTVSDATPLEPVIPLPVGGHFSSFEERSRGFDFVIRTPDLAQLPDYPQIDRPEKHVGSLESLTDADYEPKDDGYLTLSEKVEVVSETFTFNGDVDVSNE